jgi:hypothetical protein
VNAIAVVGQGRTYLGGQFTTGLLSKKVTRSFRVLKTR